MSDSKLNGNILIERYVSVRTECSRLLKTITAATDHVYKSQVLNGGDDNSASHLTMKDGLLLQAAGFRRQALEDLSNAKPILNKKTLNSSEVQEAAELIDSAKQNVIDANAKLKEAENVSDSESSAQPEKQEPEAAKASEPAPAPQPAAPKPAPQTQAQPVQEPAQAPQQSSASASNTALSREEVEQIVTDKLNALQSEQHVAQPGNVPDDWAQLFREHHPEELHPALKVGRTVNKVDHWFGERKYRFGGGKHTNHAAPQQEPEIPEAAPEQHASNK
jgi:hypothetical protein